jgi:hypothetical protein
LAVLHPDESWILGWALGSTGAIDPDPRKLPAEQLSSPSYPKASWVT